MPPETNDDDEKSSDGKCNKEINISSFPVINRYGISFSQDIEEESFSEGALANTCELIAHSL